MTRRSRVTVSLFTAGIVAVLAALVWVSRLVLDLEEREKRATALAEHQESLRLALWRMDAWLSPLITRESLRPSSDYSATAPLPYGTPDDGTAGESPLVSFQSGAILLHFRIGATGVLSSPQVPRQGLDPAAPGLLSTGAVEHEELVARVAVLLDMDLVRKSVREAEMNAINYACDYLPPSPQPQAAKEEQIFTKNMQEWSKRAQNRLFAQIRAREGVEVGEEHATGTVSAGIERQNGPGVLLPIWVEDPQAEVGRSLFYLRRSRLPEGEVLEGFLADWPAIRNSLLAEASDLLTEADLVPQPMVAAREEDQGGLLLANLPAILEAEAPTRLPKGMTPVRLTLAGAWLAILASLLTAGISLRGSLALSEKRSRFASAITHELRTPLTTFRMYSEMLLLDMVKDPEQRRDYLETLTRESARLSRLVENVLSWSGVEEGRLTPRASRVGVNGLLSGIAPVLRSRADTFGMEIAIDMDTEAGEVEVDPDTISQILFNLVDNGCKYAGPSGGPLTLTTKTEPGAVTIEVRDHGPGIPGNERHHLFSPFERAGRDGTDGIPGLGLGLALSRGLARSQGGDLTHEPPPGGGSRFVLRLPVKKANVQ